MKRALLVGALLSLALAVSGCMRTRLLLVTGYEDGNPQVTAMANAISATFDSEAVDYDLTVVNMNTLGRPTPVWRDEASKRAVVQIDVVDADTVFVAGDDAARYFGQRIVDRPALKRLVYFDIMGDPAAYKYAPPLPVTGVRELVPANEALALMKRLVPNARGVAVISDGGAAGEAVIASLMSASSLPIRVISVVRAPTLDEWMAAVRDVQDKADVLCVAGYQSVLRNRDSGIAVPAKELLLATTSASRLPDFGFDEDMSSPGGLLASVCVPADAQAKLAAQLAARSMYYGVKISRLPALTEQSYRTSLNRDRAARLGLTIPADVLEPPQPAAATPSAK